MSCVKSFNGILWDVEIVDSPSFGDRRADFVYSSSSPGYVLSYTEIIEDEDVDDRDPLVLYSFCWDSKGNILAGKVPAPCGSWKDLEDELIEFYEEEKREFSGDFS